MEVRIYWESGHVDRCPLAVWNEEPFASSDVTWNEGARALVGIERVEVGP